jgi:peptidoglycan biosynthesis protein MviN/MurJ (putative lipid II flippase)
MRSDTGSFHVSLVWLVLAGAIAGWLLGLLSSARFHGLTRPPRGRSGVQP